MPVMDPNAKRPKASRNALVYAAKQEAKAVKKLQEMQIIEKQPESRRTVKKK